MEVQDISTLKGYKVKIERKYHLILLLWIKEDTNSYATYSHKKILKNDAKNFGKIS